MATIAIIDDDDQLRRLFHSALEDAGYRVLSAAGGKTACASCTIRWWM